MQSYDKRLTAAFLELSHGLEIERRMLEWQYVHHGASELLLTGPMGAAMRKGLFEDGFARSCLRDAIIHLQVRSMELELRESMANIPEAIEIISAALKSVYIDIQCVITQALLETGTILLHEA